MKSKPLDAAAQGPANDTSSDDQSAVRRISPAEQKRIAEPTLSADEYRDVVESLPDYIVADAHYPGCTLDKIVDYVADKLSGHTGDARAAELAKIVKRYRDGQAKLAEGLTPPHVRRNEIQAAVAALSDERKAKVTEDRIEFLSRWHAHVTGHDLKPYLGCRVEIPTGNRSAPHLPLGTGGALIVNPRGQIDRRQARKGKHQWNKPLPMPEPLDPAGVLVGPVPLRHVPASQWGQADQTWRGWPYLILDIDAKDVEAKDLTVDAVLAAIQHWCPKPWAVVRSGSGGMHVWWALDRLLPATEAIELCRQLARAFTGDLQQADNRPSLRLPGSINPKWGDPWTGIRICELWREHCTWATCSVADFDHLRTVRFPARFQPYRERATVGDYNEDGVEGLLEPYGLGRDKGTGIALDTCPACGASDKAFFTRDTMSVLCLRASCPGLSSQALRAMADERGIVLCDGIDEEDRYRDFAIERIISPPTGRRVTAETIATEQELIRTTVNDALRGTHAAGAMDRPTLTVIQSGTGTGKDYTMTPEVRGWNEIQRVPAYVATQDRMNAKVEHGELGSVPLRRYVSAASLVTQDGQRCTQPGHMRATLATGRSSWMACSSCPLRPQPRSAEDDGSEWCAVRHGLEDIDPPEPSDGLGRLHLRTHASLAVPAQDRAFRGWVDERAPLMNTQTLTKDEAGAWLREAPRVSDDLAALEPYLDAMRALLGVWEHVHVLAGSGGVILPPAALAVLASAPPLIHQRLRAPEATRHDVPLILAALTDAVRDALPTSWGHARRVPVWTGDTLRLITRFDHTWPAHVVWSNATHWVWHDAISNMPSPRHELRVVGSHLRAHHLTRIHVRYPQGVRGSSERGNGINPATIGERLPDLDRALEIALQAWRVDGGEGQARVLIATYKSVVEAIQHHYAVQPVPGVDVLTVDYFERLVGINTYADYDVLIQFGRPTVGGSAEALAFGELFGGELGYADRLTVEAQEQVEGRLRAVRSDRRQVSLAMASCRPIHWMADAEIRHLTDEIEPADAIRPTDETKSTEPNEQSPVSIVRRLGCLSIPTWEAYRATRAAYRKYVQSGRGKVPTLVLRALERAPESARVSVPYRVWGAVVHGEQYDSMSVPIMRATALAAGLTPVGSGGAGQTPTYGVDDADVRTYLQRLTLALDESAGSEATRRKLEMRPRRAKDVRHALERVGAWTELRKLL